MVPLLIRGLRESTAIQRKCCVITTNMSKLVNSPLDAAHFLPSLIPGAEGGPYQSAKGWGPRGGRFSQRQAVPGGGGRAIDRGRQAGRLEPDV
jgi:hypothetical protein